MAVNLGRLAFRCAVAIFAFIGLYSSFGSVYRSKKVDSRTLSLSEKQCSKTFPGLFREIDVAVARGPFILEKNPDNLLGPLEGKIKDGKLYVIAGRRDISKEMLNSRTAILQQLYRAIITSPVPLPDTTFTISINDSPLKNAWSFARSLGPLGGLDWLMPHFGFWSWPQPFIGPVDEALIRIEKIEIPWEHKISKVIWRGTSWFNPVSDLDLRKNLLNITSGKDWADVEALQWDGVNAKNILPIEDFCKYKYIIYTEGITYSGRLPYHQACNSIILTPPLTWLQHTSHLIRPLLSSHLPISSTSYHIDGGTWPRSFSQYEANAIFVAPDWSDLEATIAYLEDHQDVAKGIAQRQKDLIVGKGFLSPAAEVCYWRKLITGWSSVAMPTKEWENVDGLRWETFALINKFKWD